MIRQQTLFGQKTLEDRYLIEDETPERMYWRVAKAYGSNEAHTSRMYSYMANFHFMPATPVLANGGTNRGLPISCYLNYVDDSLESINAKWHESSYLAANGGGIGTNWSAIRPIGEGIKQKGVTSGVIPFIKVQDAMTLAISQGSIRRGSSAAYLHISHPEIVEFIEMRKPSGDFNRKCLNVHHGVIINDNFMRHVIQGKQWPLISPNSGKVIETIDARYLFQKILEVRLQTGEPYMLFIDAVNAKTPQFHQDKDLWVNQSNLCSEITLPTTKDRTAVCCLGSVNLEYFDEWETNPLFIEDCLRFLDNVLQDFIDKTENKVGFECARHSAIQERSVGLGAMGYHFYLQKNGIAFDSIGANETNSRLFSQFGMLVDRANWQLGKELGSCPDAKSYRYRRFSYATAIAPNASISIICGQTSPSIEPLISNIFTHKTLSGSFEIRNRYLEKALEAYSKNDDNTWLSIMANGGSVQHLEWFNERHVFKTAFEMDQAYLVNQAAVRQRYIDQAQSLNLFFLGNCDKANLKDIHLLAWKQRVKSLYYLRSQSIARPEAMALGVEQDNKRDKPICVVDKGECESCQ